MPNHRSTFQTSTDKTPRYTVKEVAQVLGISSYAVRYYDNSGLVPGVYRAGANVRLFSDYSVSWLKLVHCLRTTGLPIEGVKRYIDLCLQGESTVPERAEIIFQQEKALREQLRDLKKQMEILKYKKAYYENLLLNPQPDICNPAAVSLQEPNVVKSAQ